MASPGDKMPRQSLEELLPMRSFWWLVESAPDGIIIVDNDSEGRIMLVNAQAESMFGYSEDELIDMPVEVLVPEGLQSKHVKHREEYAAEPRIRPLGIGLELEGLHKDGTVFPVEISLSPVQTKKGLLVMAIIRDVTDYRRARFISDILQNVLVPPIPEVVGEIEIATAYRPAYAQANIGGDFFDALVLGPGLLGIVIGDVSGKGPEASEWTVMSRYTLRAYAYMDPDPGLVIERLNDVVCSRIEESFITLFYGLIDLNNDSLTYVNAGHMPPLCVSGSGDEVLELECGNAPLGVVPGAKYDKCAAHFEKGARLLLYTDGVSDARGEGGLFGVSQLREFLLSNRHDSPKAFANDLIEALDKWTAGRLEDDAAALLLARND